MQCPFDPKIVTSYAHTFTSTGNKCLDASFHLSPLQATTAVAETTVVADNRGLTVFSAIDVVPCIPNIAFFGALIAQILGDS